MQWQTWTAFGCVMLMEQMTVLKFFQDHVGLCCRPGILPNSRYSPRHRTQLASDAGFCNDAGSGCHGLCLYVSGIAALVHEQESTFQGI